jgi:hypothetical protein
MDEVAAAVDSRRISLVPAQWRLAAVADTEVNDDVKEY